MGRILGSCSSVQFFLILAALILMGLMFQFGWSNGSPRSGRFWPGLSAETGGAHFLGEALLLALVGGSSEPSPAQRTHAAICIC